MSVVDVVDVIAVRDGHVPAALAVGVTVAGVLGVGRLLALVHMTVVDAVQVAVVGEVDVVAVRDGDVAAAFTVVVPVLDVGAVVDRCAHDHSLGRSRFSRALHH